MYAAPMHAFSPHISRGYADQQNSQPVSWYLAEELVSMARYRKKDWISLLKKHRNLETNSFVLKDAAGNPLQLEGPHIAVEDLVPLIPPTAYREVTVGDKTYWTFTLTVRLPGLGKV